MTEFRWVAINCDLMWWWFWMGFSRCWLFPLIVAMFIRIRWGQMPNQLKLIELTGSENGGFKPKTELVHLFPPFLKCPAANFPLDVARRWQHHRHLVEQSWKWVWNCNEVIRLHRQTAICSAETKHLPTISGTFHRRYFSLLYERLFFDIWSAQISNPKSNSVRIMGVNLIRRRRFSME